MEAAGRKMHKIRIIGIGPGHPDYLLPAAARAMAKVSILVGSPRALEEYAKDCQQTFPITGDIGAVLFFIHEALEKGEVGVLVSGDPGYYSLLDALRREFSPEILEVIPGLSAMQLAFARLALPWHGSGLLSFHGRRPEPEELCYKPGRILGMLTDNNWNSRSIAELLIEKGWPEDSRLAICLRLSYADEEIIDTTLGKARAGEEKARGILIVQGKEHLDGLFRH